MRAARWALPALLCLPGAAAADPISIVATLAPFIGGAGAAVVATAAVFVSTFGGYIYAAYAVYGGIQARRTAKRAAAAARAAYNASLTDRFVTTLRADPAWRVIYGRCITGGDIVGIFTSDKSSTDDQGNAYTRPDAYKHLVVAIAAHECEAIHEVYIDGVAVGSLDGSGWATGGEFGGASTTVYQERDIGPGASVTFDSAPTLIRSVYAEAGDYYGTAPVNISGNTATNPDGTLTIRVGVQLTVTRSRVRIEKALGTASQTASTYLQAQCPSEWTSADRLRGIAYVIVTLDLEEQRFQGGPPALTFDVSGRKVYDPRTATTAWTRNPALIVRDWLTGAWGFGVDAADISDASVIAAANACDVSISLDVGGTVTTGATYTADGAVTTEASPEAVLDELCNAMGGFATHSGGVWVVQAGAYTSPVMALTEDMQAGSIDVVQAGVGYDALYNGVRARMVESGRSVESEIDPYSNSTYVTADGRELWADISLPWTNNRARARNLARILVEQTRESLVIRYAAQLHAWPLQVGDRVTVTSAEYGWTAKVFRVTDWQWSVDSAVILTLQEDAASIYDLADAATADSAPNTGLPNPWSVPAITGLAATSGASTALRLADGTVLERVLVTWTTPSSAYVTQGGQVQIRWRRLADAPGTWREVLTRGDDDAEYLIGARGGDALVIEATAINSLGARSNPVLISHDVAGDSVAPETVASFAGSVNKGRVLWTWAPCVAADYAATEVRSTNSGWGGGGALYRGKASEWQELVAATGTLTRFARHVDNSGNVSAGSVSASVTVNAGDLVQDGAAGASAQSLSLTTTSQVFTYDRAFDPLPTSQTITLTAVLQNLSGSVGWTATRYDENGTSLGALPLGGTGNTRTASIADFNYAAYALISISLGGLSDTVTLVRLKEGTDSISAFLTNEAHTLPAAADGTVSSYSGASGTFKVFFGATDVTSAATFAMVSNPQSLTYSGPTAGSGAYSVTGGLDAGEDVGTITFRASYNGVFIDKVFSLSKSKTGASAPLLALTSTAQAFTFDQGGGPILLSIDFTANLINLSGGTLTWTATRYDAGGNNIGSAALTGSGNTRSLSSGNFGNGTSYCVVAVSYTGGYSDQITIVRLQDALDGTEAITGYLTNESHTLPAAADGTVSSYSGASGTFKVFEGISDVTAFAAFSVQSNPQTLTVTGPNSSGAYSVTGGLDAGEDAATVTLRAVYSGVTIDKVFSLSKSKTGNTGSNVATVFLFKRTTSATPPATPSASVTYNFSTGIATDLSNGWAQSLSGSGGSYRWATTAIASSNAGTDLIDPSEWAAPQLLSDATGALAGLDTVDTAQIAAGAVTSVYSETLTSTLVIGDGATVNFTPPSDAIVIVSVSGSGTLDASAGSANQSYFRVALKFSGTNYGTTGISAFGIPSGSTQDVPFTIRRVFTGLSGAQTASLRVDAVDLGNGNAGGSVLSGNALLIVEVIKR